jgi:hypothetical protein
MARHRRGASLDARVATAAGLEPAPLSFEGSCSLPSSNAAWVLRSEPTADEQTACVPAQVRRGMCVAPKRKPLPCTALRRGFVPGPPGAVSVHRLRQVHIGVPELRECCRSSATLHPGAHVPSSGRRTLPQPLRQTDRRATMEIIPQWLLVLIRRLRRRLTACSQPLTIAVHCFGSGRSATLPTRTRSTGQPAAILLATNSSSPSRMAAGRGSTLGRVASTGWLRRAS